MHNENIHDRHPEAKKIIHWLERERANDFGQFLNPFKKSFKMNSMAQANTDFGDFYHGTNLGRVHPGPGLWIKRPGLSPGPVIWDPTKGRV
jgi:hypothetical protein